LSLYHIFYSLSSWLRQQESHTTVVIATTPNPTKSEKSKHQVRLITTSHNMQSIHLPIENECKKVL